MIGLQLTSNLAEAAGALRDAADQLPDRLERTVATMTDYLEAQLQDEAPVSKQRTGYDGRSTNRPGTLRESIRGEADGMSSQFFAAFYAEYVIGGTAAHTISGNPLLSFEWDKAGGFVVFASVHHPGTAPNDFRLAALATAADEAEDELDAIGDWFAQLVTA